MRKATVALVCALLLGTSGAALADSVLLGSDYLETIPPTFFDFGGPIGSVALVGRPINPPLLGSTDTIVQRRADAILPVVGGSDTIPIELVQLSLVSASPVTIGTSFFDVFVHLTPSTSSIGTATIRHEVPDNGGPAPEGTFDSFFDVFFTADFTEVGNPFNTFSVVDHTQLQALGTPWSHEPMLPGRLLVTGPAGDQNANDHTTRPPLFSDFHIQQVTEIKILGGPGQHTAIPAAPPHPGAIPGPGTLVLVSLGLPLALCFARRARA